SWLYDLQGKGLSGRECEICDFFVYLRQYGCGTASLNVTVAASIVLHNFGVWAGFSERSRDGNKFVVAERDMRSRLDTVPKQKKRSLKRGSAEGRIQLMMGCSLRWMKRVHLLTFWMPCL
ncbi:unnamed protein product, partial [Linum tenue]